LQDWNFTTFAYTISLFSKYQEYKRLSPGRRHLLLLLQKINNINVTIWVEEELAIGFECADGKSIPKGTIGELIEILEEEIFSEYFDDVEVESKQIYRKFLYGEKFKKSLDEAVDYFSIIFEKLIEGVK
jgi:hypothetical protein